MPRPGRGTKGALCSPGDVTPGFATRSHQPRPCPWVRLCNSPVGAAGRARLRPPAPGPAPAGPPALRPSPPSLPPSPLSPAQLGFADPDLAEFAGSEKPRCAAACWRAATDTRQDNSILQGTRGSGPHHPSTRGRGRAGRLPVRVRGELQRTQVLTDGQRGGWLEKAGPWGQETPLGGLDLATGLSFALHNRRSREWTPTVSCGETSSPYLVEF